MYVVGLCAKFLFLENRNVTRNYDAYCTSLLVVRGDSVGDDDSTFVFFLFAADMGTGSAGENGHSLRDLFASASAGNLNPKVVLVGFALFHLLLQHGERWFPKDNTYTYVGTTKWEIIMLFNERQFETSNTI